MRARVSLLVLVPVVCGVLAGLFAGADFRLAPVRDELKPGSDPITFQKSDRQPLEIVPGRWASFLHLFEDFDLTCNVELPANTELDIVLRRVEPRPEGDRNLPFTGRFTVLRLSTIAAGEPWRDREQALFGRRDGGVLVSPGYQVTVSVQARGDRLTANVGGRNLPEHRVIDGHGGAAMIARGGTALLWNMTIMPREGGFEVPAWLLGLMVALCTSAIGAAAGVSYRRLWYSMPLLPLGAWAGRELAFADLLPLCEPALYAQFLVVLAGVPLAAVVWQPARRRTPVGVLALAASTLLVVSAASHELPRRAAGEGPLLPAVFGERSGENPAEALAGLLRGPHGLHDQRGTDPRVLLLGGGLLLAGDEHLELLLDGELRLRKLRFEVMSLPTIDGHADQQWTMFEACYPKLGPQVVALALGGDEMQPERDATARAMSRELLRKNPDGLDAAQFAAIHAAADGAEAPRSSPEQLLAVLLRAQVWCELHQCRLVLLVADDLPKNLRETLGDARFKKVPRLPFRRDDSRAALAKALAELIAG